MEIVLIVAFAAFGVQLFIVWKIFKTIRQIEKDAKERVKRELEYLQRLTPPDKIDPAEFDKRSDMFLNNVFDWTKGHNHDEGRTRS